MHMTRPLAVAFIIEDVEGLANPAIELLDADARHVEQRHVVELDRIRNGVEAVVHAVGQIVVDPVGDVFDAVGAQQVERRVGLGQAGPEPAAHLLAVALDDCPGLGDDRGSPAPSTGRAR